MLNYACVQGFIAGEPKAMTDRNGKVFCKGYMEVVTKGNYNLVNFQSFGGCAEYILKYCHAGDLVTFSGDIRGFYRWQDKDTGETIYRMCTFTVLNVESLEKRKESDELPPELDDNIGGLEE